MMGRLSGVVGRRHAVCLMICGLVSVGMIFAAPVSRVCFAVWLGVRS